MVFILFDFILILNNNTDYIFIYFNTKTSFVELVPKVYARHHISWPFCQGGFILALPLGIGIPK